MIDIARANCVFCAGFFSTRKTTKKFFEFFSRKTIQITPCCPDMVRKEG